MSDQKFSTSKTHHEYHDYHAEDCGDGPMMLTTMLGGNQDDDADGHAHLSRCLQCLAVPRAQRTQQEEAV